MDFTGAGGGGDGGEDWSDEEGTDDEEGGGGRGGGAVVVEEAADEPDEIEYDPEANSITLTLNGAIVSLDIEIQVNALYHSNVLAALLTQN